MAGGFGWLDVEEIAELLFAKHGQVDPLRLRFTELRRLVEGLEGFEADEDHPVNEKILETIQGHWYRLRMGIAKEED
jgi:FeS assembly protein IscX